MSNLINPKPRFGYHPSTDMIYDYQAQRDVPVTDRYQAPDGTWNLHEVKRLILAGETIEAARVPSASPPSNVVRLKQAANEGAKPEVGAQGEGSAAPVGAPPQEGASDPPGIGAEQLQAAKLSDLQRAALGITDEQLSSTGVRADHAAGWKLSPARIKALKLSPEQAKILSGAV